MSAPTSAGAAQPLLSARAITKHFPIKRGLLQRVVGQVQAVDGVDIDGMPGPTVGMGGKPG